MWIHNARDCKATTPVTHPDLDHLNRGLAAALACWLSLGTGEGSGDAAVSFEEDGWFTAVLSIRLTASGEPVRCVVVSLLGAALAWPEGQASRLAVLALGQHFRVVVSRGLFRRDASPGSSQYSGAAPPAPHPSA